MRRTCLALAVAISVGVAVPGYAEPVPIGGRIVDSSGRPVRGASVEVGPVPDRFGWSELRLQDRIFPAPVARTASRNDGRFEVAAPSPGMWRVTVAAPGFVPRLYYLTPAFEGVELPLLEMSRDTPLRVRVLSPQGKPVAGARIVAGDEMSGTSGFWTVPIQLVVTGADGSAQLYRARRGRIEVEALAAGYPKAEAKADPTQQTAELRLAAACARPVRVTLQEKKEEPPRPVEGALVTSDGWTLGATDAAGHLTVAAPCDRELRFEVATRDGRRAEATLPRGPAPAAGAAPFAVPLPALPARMSGRVVDETTRKPVAGALVWPANDPSAFALTDAKGIYTIPLPTGDSPRVAGVATGYLPTMEAARAAAGPTLALQPVAMASGTVVDEAGKPVADAVVRAGSERGGRRPGRGGTQSGMMARSDARGLFQLRLPPGQSATLIASHPDYTAARLELPELAPRSARTGLKLVLARGLSGFGRVVDAAGRPVVGAQVSLVPAGQGREPFAPPFVLEDQAASSPAFTDAQGGFVLEHLEPGRYNLETEARGFAPMSVPGIQLAEGQPRADLGTVTLAPGAVLEGVVVDPRDRPVPGAWVQVGSRARFNPGGAADEEPVLTSADGTFAVADLRPGEKVMLFVSKQGYSRASYNEIEVPPAVPLRVVLKPGMRVAGRVVDETGKPVAGARVRLSQIATSMVMGGRGQLMDRMSGFAASEDDGSFEMEGVEAGKARLVIEAQGFLEGEVPGFDVVEGRDVEGLEVVLRRGSVIAGRISGPDGAPVSGARVQVVDDPSNRSMARFMGASSDGDGNYRLEGVPEGASSFAAQAEGFQRTVRDLEVRPGENRLDFRLDGGHEVSGLVVDAGGQPVAGAVVRLSSGDRLPTFSRGNRLEARSGTDGSFRVPGVATGSYEVAADKEGYAPARLEAVNVAGRVQGLELRLEAGGGVQGRLLGLDLTELAGASVSAYPVDPTAGRNSMGLMRGGQVDYQGQYRISGLAAGEWRVSARSESGRQATGQVAVTAGSDATLDLDLAGGFTLTGRVMRGGEGVSNAYVAVSGEAGGGRATTDPQGAFRIQGLKPGTYELQAMQFDSGLNHQETLEVSGDRDVLIEIATRRVSGRVVDATDQSPVSGVVVSLEAADSNSGGPRFGMGRGNRSDGDGAFTITDVSPGSYRLVAQMEGYAPAEATVQVGTTDDVDGVRLAIEPTQGLTLEVRTSLGNPPSEVRTALLDGSGRIVVSGSYLTGENGRVRVSNAPPGSWRLLVSAGDGATVARDVQVPGPPVPILLTPGGALVVTAAGLPSGSKVTVVGTDGQPFRSVLYSFVMTEWPLREGRAVIEGLPPGQWRVRASAPDGQAREASASVAAGATSQVVLR